MKVPFINYQAQYKEIGEELRPLLEEVIFERSDFIMRDDLKRFEQNMAAFLGTRHAVGVKSCTDGLMLALRAAGVGPGHEVITVAHTFVATIAAIHWVGATPILVDINDEDLMDVAELKKAITPRTRAIIPVHLNGRICDMKEIMALAQEHDLLVIEDSAQSLGAYYDGVKGGAIGLAGCFSFFPAKLLGTAGDGGLVSTNSDEIARKIYLLRDHGRETKNDLAFYGFNSRLDNLHAAILDLKLKYFPRWLERRRHFAAIYHDRLQDLPLSLPVPPVKMGTGLRWDVYQNYAVKTPLRDQLVAHLRESGVETLISWPKPVWENEGLNLKGFHLPVTEKLCRTVLSLPMNSELSDAEVNYVCDVVAGFFAKHGKEAAAAEAAAR